MIPALLNKMMFPSAAAAITGATWDPATATNVTLSNGNLTAASTINSSLPNFAPVQGVKVATGSGQTSGKYYFEITVATDLDQGTLFGVCTPSATYDNLRNSTGTGGLMATSGGGFYANGVFGPGGEIWAGYSQGDIVGIAVDLDHRNMWLMVVGGPDFGSKGWNDADFGDLSGENPATNTGGAPILAGTIVPVITFGGNPPIDKAGDIFTADFGATAFSGTVPSGFTSGWPV